METKNKLVQRIAELGAERDEARDMFYSACQASAAFAVLLGMDETENDPPSIADAIEDLVTERDELRARLAEIEAHEPSKRRNDITLNAAQLRRALDFAAPDFDRDEDQRKIEVSIGWREMGDVLDDDGHPDPAGYVAWLAEYPEEGCIPLPESWEITPVPAQAAPDGWRMVLTEARDLFAAYAEIHRARGPEHAEKAARNEAMAAKINAALAAAPEHKA